MRREWMPVVGLVAVACGVLSGCPDEPVMDGPGGEGFVPPNAVGGQGGPAGQPGAPGGAAGGAGAVDGQTGTAGAPPSGSMSPEPGPVAGEDASVVVKLDLLPDQVLSQAQIESSGDGIKVSGTLSGDACKGKKIRIDVMEMRGGHPEIVTVKNMEGIGAFEILVPKSGEKAWLTAFCDVDGDDFFRQSIDYTGAYKDNPVSLSSDVSGVDMAFSLDALPTGQGMPPMEEAPAP